jgi:hypothetical protein
MKISLKSFFSSYLSWYLFFVSISGIVAVVGYSTSRALILYKDFFAILIPSLLLISFVVLRQKLAASFQYYLIVIIFGLIFVFTFILLTALFSRFDVLRTIIQFRLELFIAFSLLTGALLLALTPDEQYEILMKLVRLYIILAVVNALITIGESVFAQIIYSVIGINPGPKFTEFGKSHGLLLRSVMGRFRAIGLLTGPFSLSEYLFFGMLLVRYVRPSRQLKYIILMAVAIYCSTSKTAAIMTALFLVYFFMRKFFSERFSLSITTFGTIIVFIVSFIITTDKDLYQNTFSRGDATAENSVLFRMQNVEKVMGSPNYSDYYGAGYAVNGNAMVGADNADTVALDSAHIYILSSYGNVGVISCLLLFLMMCMLMYKFTMEGMPSLVYLYWVISFLTNFMYNNPMLNYPGYAFPIIMSALFISLRRYRPSPAH